ncbi:LLM class flavin-dependent oxidoreductase [Streptomyces sp. NPDC102462]|uniref:LLM class flavin-dependent oxidoreductase n=1 Tax=Streptomyces sp. NPDC102462 TaxID=3366178 RepID=UPI003813013D
MPAGPQGRPVIVQAGGTEGGLRLAGDFADVVFTVAQTRAKAVAFRDEVRRRATAAGRRPDDVKVSLGVVVLVSATEKEARRRAEELYATLPLERLVAALNTGLGLPADAFGPDDPITLDDLPDSSEKAAFSVGFAESTRALIAERPRSPRELVRRSAGGSGHRLLIGSAPQVADDLESWFRAGAADGFTIMPAETAVDFENFTRLVVPILQDRGLFRNDHTARTLRERFGLPRPVRDVAGRPA